MGGGGGSGRGVGDYDMDVPRRQGRSHSGSQERRMFGGGIGACDGDAYDIGGEGSRGGDVDDGRRRRRRRDELGRGVDFGEGEQVGTRQLPPETRRHFSVPAGGAVDIEIGGWDHFSVRRRKEGRRGLPERERERQRERSPSSPR
ncbi:unnamed protein product, partial [Ascophyllum nodosum]